jgi:glyoxylase-like metal-dependent hydrolase (beta-lactamase superfamily II)
LEHCPGPSVGAIWANLPDQGILFLGDIVVINQPPFLAGADLPAWIERLHMLLKPTYQNYLMVSGRNGLVHQNDVYRQLEYLERVHHLLTGLSEGGATETATEMLIIELLAGFNIPKEREAQYHNRLRWGLRHYYIRHYLSCEDEALED